ncbi:PatB family C-S lyase [Erysipelotrichaceae bacterium OttesenSCG-928-M19]|nr:PatB family C-S lyase [Erysipelotrichaceae bacterium OttesenSCG-928-M19]
MNNFDEILDRRQYHAIKFKDLSTDYLMLGTADMDFKSSSAVQDALLKKAQQGNYGYELKSADYYQAIIDWYQRHYNWQITKEMIAVAPGIWTSLKMCIDTFSQIGDKILVHSPTFHPIVNIVKKSQRELVINDLIYKNNYYSINFDTLEKQLKDNIKIFILINPHNPSGRVFTKDELIKIGELCLKYNVLVISDEVHGGIVFDNNKHLPFGSINKTFSTNSIIINSASKAYNLQGLTHAYLIIANNEYREQFEETLSCYDLDFATNIFSMTALKAAYNESDQWLQDVNKYLQNNLDYLDNYLKEELSQIKLIRPEASYLAWLDISALRLSTSEIKELFINKAKMYFSFEESFNMHEGNFIRINFGCPLSVLQEALKRLKEVLQDFE